MDGPSHRYVPLFPKNSSLQSHLRWWRWLHGRLHWNQRHCNCSRRWWRIGSGVALEYFVAIAEDATTDDGEENGDQDTDDDGNLSRGQLLWLLQNHHLANGSITKLEKSDH